MQILIEKKESVEIADNVFSRILNLYPEEELALRPILQKALVTGNISFDDLKSESDKILIPWQMFLLNEENLNNQITHIEQQRTYKVSSKLIAKRRGIGDVTSKRIIDRLIRQQNFVIKNNNFPINDFCGCLKRMHIKSAVNKILNYFDISYNDFWSYSSKAQGLSYLINKVESKNINISRGVLTNKILPNWQVVPNNIYKNTSGFVIKDDYVPFIFLPSETNPDEVESRQIYTLVYLLAIIGLEQYEFFLEKDFKAKLATLSGVKKKLHNITSELLIPTSETNKLKEVEISVSLRDSLANKYKVSPSALVTTLKMRRIISDAKYKELKPEPYSPPPSKGSSGRRSPKVMTSVKKFCGQISYNSINQGITSGSLSSIQAQYLIFGSANKKSYLKYRKELGL